MINPIEYLYFAAKTQPDAPAVRTMARSFTYRQLLSLVRGVAAKLSQAGVRPGHVVYVCVAQYDVAWVFNLALMHEAAIVCSAHGYEPAPQGLGIDFAVSDRSVAGLPQDRTLIIDNAWLAASTVVANGLAPKEYESERSCLRLILTSGTTGDAKAVAMSVSNTLARVSAATRSSGVGSELNLLRLSSAVGAHGALRCLMEGSVLYLADSYDDAVHLVYRHRIRSLNASPIQIAGVIEQLRRKSIRLTTLEIVKYTGGAATPKLIAEIRNELCPVVLCTYGSTEGGVVAKIYAHDPKFGHGVAGYVYPAVGVQVVDDDHQPVAPGTEGAIRIRTPVMASGYLNNPEATAESFIDGWFYPGDRGVLGADGLLSLRGRRSEMINRGGVKIDPASIDQHLASFAGVEDAAAFGYRNAEGVEEIGAAIVVRDGFDLDALREHLLNVLGRTKSPSAYVLVPSIPRNPNGKPLRAQLQERLGEMLRGRPAADSGAPKPH